MLPDDWFWTLMTQLFGTFLNAILLFLLTPLTGLGEAVSEWIGNAVSDATTAS